MGNKPIGGFFELELPASGKPYHSKALALSTGRACIRLMLQNLFISKCYVPYYACETLYDPFRAENISFEFYEINELLEPRELPVLKENEYILYINYFGIKFSAIDHLIEKYGNKLLIDNTHFFFHKGY